MPRIYVRLFGGIQVELDGRPSPLRHRGDLLLARLILEGRPIAREALAGWLWPHAERGAALHSLREALFRLRAALGDDVAGAPLVEVTRTTVALRVARPTPVSAGDPPTDPGFVRIQELDLACDALEARAVYEDAQRHPHRRIAACDGCLRTLTGALALSERRLFGDLPADLGEEVASWADAWRDRFDGWRAGALGAFAEAAAGEGRHTDALQYARAQLVIHPWDEGAHRRVMRALAAEGRPAEAIAHYEAYAARLDTTLGAAPDDATEELCERLRHGEPLDRAAEVAAVPAASNTFVGRDMELAWIGGRFADPQVRWITIVGPGGVGKTRLSLEAARRLAGRFRDGAVVVGLAGVSVVEDVPTAVAAALGIQLGSGDPARAVGAWLRTREVLLVLDNLEQLVAARGSSPSVPDAAVEAKPATPESPSIAPASTPAPVTAGARPSGAPAGGSLHAPRPRDGDGAAHVFRAWLDAAPELRVLATSRERLGLMAEHLLPVRGLPLTGGHDPWSAPALRLWAARVHQLDPFRPLDETEAAGALAVARLVDGLPLAIELAAEASAGSSAAAAAAQLQHGLDWLVTSHHDAPPHQRALSVVTASTWARLDTVGAGLRRSTGDERGDPLARTLERLATFVGRFDLEAAEAVAGADAATLRALVDRSLVLDEGAGRWSVHGVLRLSAAERVGAGWVALQRRHAEWFVGQLDAAREDLRLQRDRSVRDRIAAAWDDLRAAWRNALLWRDEALIERMLDPLVALVAWMDWTADGVRLLEEALRSGVPPAVVRAIQVHQGLIAWRAGDGEVSVTNLRAGLAAAEAAGDRRLEVRALAQLGAVRRNQGAREEALRLLEAAVALGAHGDALDVATAEYRLAVARYEQDRLQEALALAESAITHFEAAGSSSQAAHVQAVVGVCRTRLGDTSGVEVCRAAVRSIRKNGWFGQGDAANCLALALGEVERWGEGGRAARAAEASYEIFGFRPGMCTARLLQALAASAQGDVEAARALRTSAAELALSLGAARSVGEALVAWAAVDLAERREDRARRIAASLAQDPANPAPDGLRLLLRRLTPSEAFPEDLSALLVTLYSAR